MKDVIENGIVIDTDINHKNRGYNTVVIAAPINISGERYICQVVIRRNKNGSRFYLHEVVAQKKLPKDAFVTNLAQKPASLGDLAKVLQNIVTTSDMASKIVDENGEPLVVYRGAVIDPLERPKGEGVIAPQGYFTADKDYAVM